MSKEGFTVNAERQCALYRSHLSSDESQFIEMTFGFSEALCPSAHEMRRRDDTGLDVLERHIHCERPCEYMRNIGLHRELGKKEKCFRSGVLIMLSVSPVGTDKLGDECLITRKLMDRGVTIYAQDDRPAHIGLWS